MKSSDLHDRFPWIDTNEEVSGADVIEHLCLWYYQLQREEAELARPRMSDNVRRLIGQEVYESTIECLRDCLNEEAHDRVSELTDQSLMDEYLQWFDTENDWLEQMAASGFTMEEVAEIRESEAFKRHWAYGKEERK